MSGYSFLRIEKNKKKKFIPLNEGEAKKINRILRKGMI